MSRSRKKFWIVTGTALLVMALVFSWNEHTNYHKVTKIEYFSKLFLYSATNQLAAVTSIWEGVSFSLSMPNFRQENALTCEVAALRTALNYQGVSVSESELLSKLNFDTRSPMSGDGIWGDPEKGFVGDINGSIFHRTGFGVYDKPILDLAREYRNAEIIADANLEMVLDEVLAGNPVVVWGLLSRRAAVSWFTEEGKFVEARPGEHARVVVGFTGHPENPIDIIMLDPIYGKIRMNKSKFISDWAIMSNRAVVVYKTQSNLELAQAL